MAVGSIIINSAHIKDKIERFSFPKAQSYARKEAKIILTERKKQFLQKFQSHRITKEIEGGESGDGTLDVSGNLFSFIGFDQGSTPIQDLYEYLEESIFLPETPGQYNAADKTISFKFSLPNPEGIKDVTDLSKYTHGNNKTNYGAGRSWVYSIERGIPGLSQYKYSEDDKELGGDSRSGTGLQRKNVIHPGATYKAQKYLSDLLKILLKK